MADREKIVGGPSKWDLMLALFERKTVDFTLEDGRKFVVEVRALSNERGWSTVTFDEIADGGADGNWFIEGDWAFRPPSQRTYKDYILYIAYSTVTREGVLSYHEHSMFSNGLHHERLRYEWGDRVWGDSSWRQ